MKFTKILIVAITLALTACGGSKLEGSYGNDGSKKYVPKGVLLTLKKNGKAVYMGAMEMDYEVDGKDVKLHMPQGTMILKGHDDGSLDFPFLGNLMKMPT